MNAAEVVGGACVALAVATGIGFAYSIPLAKRRHEARLVRERIEQVAATLRLARRRNNIADLSGEHTEAFSPLVAAHSPEQPGRKVLDFATRRRAEVRHIARRFRHGRRGVLLPRGPQSRGSRAA